jgi:hypothetical protein
VNDATITTILIALFVCSGVAYVAWNIGWWHGVEDTLDLMGSNLKRANDQAASLALENDRLYKLLDAKEQP